MKRITSILLLVLFLFSAFPFYSFADETDGDDTLRLESSDDGAEGSDDAGESKKEDKKDENRVGFEYEFEHTSESLCLVNLDTGITVFTENANERRAVGSLTKIMTYIIAYENIPNIENTKITITQFMIEKTLYFTDVSPNYLLGEEVSALDLLHLLMIPSGNDAAVAFQTYIDTLYPESESGSYFIDLMNKKAKELGCDDTNFSNTLGLDDGGQNYSTASDMVKIALYASKLPYFSEIVNKTYYTIPANEFCYYDRTVYATNYMLTHANDDESFYIYATGMKAGFTDDAGYCVAASATYSGYSYICIALGAPLYDENGYYVRPNGAMADAANMFRWAFTQVSLKIIANEGDLLGDVDVLYSWDVKNLQLVARETIYTLLPDKVSVAALKTVIEVPDSVEAPIKKGEKIGKVSYYYDGQLITTADLIASKSVSRSEVIHTVETGKEIMNSGWFKGILTVVIVLLVLYFVLLWRTNKKKQKMRRIKRRRNL